MAQDDVQATLQGTVLRRDAFPRLSPHDDSVLAACTGPQQHTTQLGLACSHDTQLGGAVWELGEWSEAGGGEGHCREQGRLPRMYHTFEL